VTAVIERPNKRASWDQSRTAFRAPDDDTAVIKVRERNELAGWRRFAAFVGGRYVTG
jgi:hypothetical protein